jgi:hypothetical protein
MDADLIHLIREHYPFPIAHAIKRAMALRDDDAQKLKSLIDAAEAVIRFLALVVLAQLHRDLEHQQAPPLGSRGEQLAEDLRNPSFGRWQGILRDVLKCYSAHRHLLMMPELFDFYFKPSRGQRLQVQPVVSQAIDPLITLRNQRIGNSKGIFAPASQERAPCSTPAPPASRRSAPGVLWYGWSRARMRRAAHKKF